MAATATGQQLKGGTMITLKKDSASVGLVRSTSVNADTGSAVMREYIKRIADSVAALRSGGIDADSVRRVAIRYTFVAQLKTVLNPDTSAPFYFGDADTYGDGNPTGLYSLTTAHTTLIPYAIHVSHRWNDSGVRRARDTTVYYTILDSIPRNSSLWVYYDPAFNGNIAGGYQKIALAKGAQNANAVTDLSSNPVQVPLILKPGTGQVGVLPDHWFNVTLICIEKVPGRKYW